MWLESRMMTRGSFSTGRPTGILGVSDFWGSGALTVWGEVAISRLLSPKKELRRSE